MMIVNPWIFAAGVSPGTDQYWTSVSCLLHFDGNYQDQKGNDFSQAGTIAYGDGFFDSALSVDGSKSYSGIVSEPSSRFGFGVGDFTIEFFICLPQGSPASALISHFNVGSDNGWQIYCDAQGLVYWYEYIGSGRYVANTSVSIKDGRFHQIAICRRDKNILIYIDGSLSGQGSTSVSYGYSGLKLSIGYQEQGNARYPTTGMFDELRITKGVCRYPEDFNVPDQPFPNR